MICGEAAPRRGEPPSVAPREEGRPPQRRPSNANSNSSMSLREALGSCARDKLAPELSTEGGAMGLEELEATAKALVAEHKGILAADESDGTIKKRFDSIGVDSTEDNRRAYRELLFTTEGAEEFISGVILFDETIRQSASDGTPFPKLLESKGSSPASRSTRARSRSRWPRARRSRRARRAARATRGVPRARRALRQVARDLLDRRPTGRASTASGRTPTRSRATPRCARRRGSSRSSSPRCSGRRRTRSSESSKATGVSCRPSIPSSTTSASCSKARCSSRTWCCRATTRNRAGVDEVAAGR